MFLLCAAGVVFKEYVELVKPGIASSKKQLVAFRRYPSRTGYTTNEWRLWFVCKELLQVSANSFQAGPKP